MSLLRELSEQQSDHVPIMEALSAVASSQPNHGGGMVSVGGAAKSFFNANPGLVIGAATLAVAAYAGYRKAQRNTITLHAKDAYERRMITSVVDSLTSGNKFRVIRTKFSGGGKTWILKRVGPQA